MTDKEKAVVLTRAIDEAITAGWKHDMPKEITEFRVSAAFGNTITLYEDTMEDELCWQELLYNHNFARALWGTEPAGVEDFYSTKYPDLNGSSWPEMWEYHLKEMVISDDPLDYVAKHMP